MHGTYNLWLVALSYVVASVASYTALELSRRVSHSSGTAARAWLGAGAVSMGIGIWTMHFIGMLAFSLPIAVSYDVRVTLLSLFVGIAASAFAVFVASRRQNSLLKIIFSGLLLGAGIAAMHYTGMVAMEMDAAISYDLKVVALSIFIAIAAACVALWIMFTLIETRSRYLGTMKIGAGMIMGIAICGMHYTGMAAADYVHASSNLAAGAPVDHTWLGSMIAAMALVILGVTHLTIFFEQRLQLQQRHSEQAEQEKIQLSDVLDESSNEIYFFDSESYRFVNVNRGAVENLGFTIDQIKTMTPLDLMPNFTEASFERKLRPLRDGTENELLFEARNRRSDGTDYFVQVHLQLSRMTEPPMYVAIVTDITARKDLEMQLLQAQKMQSIGQLAAGIAHEINTPAQFVGDNTRFVQDAFKDLINLCDSLRKLNDAVRNEVVTIELLDDVAASMESADLEFLIDEVPAAIEQSLDGISRISNIVRAMKEFSHPAGREFEAMDLNNAIRNTVTVASNEWKYFADVETNLDEDVPPVLCLQQEVNQVFLNLIVNAAHAIEAGRDDESAEKGRIAITTRASAEYVEIDIADSGCGIPDDLRDRIFEPFFTTKEVGKGTGQGLAMAYKTIVDKHRGELRVESTPGEGTTFTIRLPIANQDSAENEEAA